PCGPISATKPANSAPRTQGNVNGQRDVPARESRSLWLTPQALTSMRTSSPASTGSSTLLQRSTSGSPYSQNADAHIELGSSERCGHPGVRDRLRPRVRADLARSQTTSPERVGEERAVRNPVADGDSEFALDAARHARHCATREHERLGSVLVDRPPSRLDDGCGRFWVRRPLLADGQGKRNNGDATVPDALTSEAVLELGDPSGERRDDGEAAGDQAGGVVGGFADPDDGNVGQLARGV